MNAGISKRVVGFAVLVVAVLAILLFLPRSGTDTKPGAIPVAAVPVGAQGPLDAVPSSPAEADAAPADEAAVPDHADTPPSTPAAAPTLAASPAPGTVWRDTASQTAPVVKPASPAVKTAPAVKPAVPAPTVEHPAPHSPAAPAPGPAREAASHGRFYIQVASFGDAANAAAALKKLEGLGYRGTTGTTKLNGKTWTRVQVGPYADQAAARAAQARLKAQGYGGSRILSR